MTPGWGERGEDGKMRNFVFCSAAGRDAGGGV